LSPSKAGAWFASDNFPCDCSGGVHRETRETRENRIEMRRSVFPGLAYFAYFAVSLPAREQSRFGENPKTEIRVPVGELESRRAGGRRSATVHGPDARPKLEVEPPHEPKGSRTGILPVAGASSPSFVHGQDARGDRQDACPTTERRFRDSRRKEFVRGILSPTLSPLVPRGEREPARSGGASELRPKSGC